MEVPTVLSVDSEHDNIISIISIIIIIAFLEVFGVLSVDSLEPAEMNWLASIACHAYA